MTTPWGLNVARDVIEVRPHDPEFIQAEAYRHQYRPGPENYTATLNGEPVSLDDLYDHLCGTPEVQAWRTLFSLKFEH